MFRFSPKSDNRKTGPIPVSMTSKESCPPTCPFKGNGCYAEGGPVNIWWNRCGMEEATFLAHVSMIENGQLWRHNQAGDLPHDGGEIRIDFLDRLVAANRGKRGFTYTHHALTPSNENAIRRANLLGFTVNVSANTPTEAVEYARKGLPTVCVAPKDTARSFKLNNIQFLICPAVTGSASCATCGLCQRTERNFVIAFPAHGVMFKKVEKVLDSLH